MNQATFSSVSKNYNLRKNCYQFLSEINFYILKQCPAKQKQYYKGKDIYWIRGIKKEFIRDKWVNGLKGKSHVTKSQKSQ